MLLGFFGFFFLLDIKIRLYIPIDNEVKAYQLLGLIFNSTKLSPSDLLLSVPDHTASHLTRVTEHNSTKTVY